MVGCLTCDSTTDCLSCDAVNNFGFSGSACDCVSPYLLQSSTGTCQTCSTLQPMCQLCSTETTCMLCLTGSYLDGSNQCQPCPVGCTTCSSLTVCTTCDSASQYTLVGTMCQCSVGYTPAPITGICSAVCGDGLVASSEACDDGNLVNGDGCSSTCQIEANYSCFAFPGQPSTCSYSQPLNFSLSGVVKSPNANTVSFNFDIGPMLPSLSSINFSQLIQTSVPLQNPRFVLSPNGKLRSPSTTTKRSTASPSTFPSRRPTATRISSLFRLRA